jgi:hypothetical protein
MSLGAQLARYVSHQRGAFDWATNNCCTFAAGWVREVEGNDVMPKEPTPDAKAALRLIEKRGSLANVVSEQLGREPIHPSQAQVGDLVMFPGHDHPARAIMGICNGRTSILHGVDGEAIFMATARAMHAWRVGA